MTAPKPDKALQKRLRLYKATTLNSEGVAGLSHKETAQRLGLGSGTTVSKYLSGSFAGNLAKLERLLWAAFKSVPTREAAADGLFDTPAMKLIRALCVELKEKHWMGVAFGDGGIGKTCGANRVMLTDLSAVYVAITTLKRDRYSLIRQLYDLCKEPKAPCRGVPKMVDYIIQFFTASDRILIIDDAHLLNNIGRQFYCDLHNLSKVAVLFMGNPVLVAEWRKLQQQHSRLRRCVNITESNAINDLSVKADVRAQAEAMLRLHAPASGEELLAPAMRLVKGEGHLRSLETSLILAVKIHGGMKTPCWQTAFEAAETAQLRNYGGNV